LLLLAQQMLFAYDLQAACSSFCTECLLQLPTFNQEGIKVLLIGADKMSSIVDYTDRSTLYYLQVLSHLSLNYEV
jgi:3-oxoacyl-[acyl-carrier-protein] synthase III